MVGTLGAEHLPRLIAFTVLTSMGILLASLGLRLESLTAPVLLYLIVSVLATSAFFMLSGMTARTRVPEAPLPNMERQDDEPAYTAYGIKRFSIHDASDDTGIALPAVMAFLGMMFTCCTLLVSGLPPLPGFLAKFALLATMLREQASPSTFVLGALIVLSGLVAVIALSRIGMSLFWSVTQRTTPRLRVLEAIPVATLIAIALGLTLGADPVMRYLDSAAKSLHQPDAYIRAVLREETRRERPGEVRP